jgi:hypothetical protein
VHLEVVRALTAWLRDPVTGANAQLGAIPRDADHAAGSVPAAVATVTCPYEPDADGDACAKWLAPSQLPALYVTPDGPVVAEGEVATVNRQSEDVAVVVRFLAPGDDAASRAASAYALRAVIRSLRGFNADTAAGRAARSRNGIQILTCSRITFGPWNETVGQSRAVAIVGAEFVVRDVLP